MKQVIVVAAVIQNNNKQILCALRSETMSLPNHWEFPGGKVEIGEDHYDALQREIHEELACTIMVKEKITSVTHHYDHMIVHLHTYWCEIIKGYPLAKEHASLQWVDLKDLKSLRFAPADLSTIHLITKG
ncbi:CTP pyrophosphohydrolase [Halalkalibacter krulwichiae]|uniref:8-oxo-dGTP diphosphatase n=1 Tax=Halalkalibacter krulwichiae TaxID=199441 RepID=A0A1Y9THG9_9BACI|nr:CTP pyrophosphohydrolase [Halalkalibacter krulwichiae]